MSLAERTREAVRAEPFVHEALRAGVVNYSAAARHLDVEGDEEAIATALRRYAGELEAPTSERRPRVRMQRGVDLGTPDEDTLLAVGGSGIVEGGDRTAVLATGDLSAEDLAPVLVRLSVEAIPVDAAGAAEGTLVVVVGPREGANALRIVEDVLERSG